VLERPLRGLMRRTLGAVVADDGNRRFVSRPESFTIHSSGCSAVLRCDSHMLRGFPRPEADEGATAVVAAGSAVRNLSDEKIDRSSRSRAASPGDLRQACISIPDSICTVIVSSAPNTAHAPDRSRSTLADLPPIFSYSPFASASV